MPTTIDGPIPEEQRQELPADWIEHLPMSDDYTVGQFHDAMRLYAAGRSCAECEVLTGVNAEVLRKALQSAGMIRSASEAQRVKSIQKRRHVKRLLERDREYGTMNIARLAGVCRGTVIDWREQWEAGVPLLEWSAS